MFRRRNSAPMCDLQFAVGPPTSAAEGRASDEGSTSKMVASIGHQSISGLSTTSTREFRQLQTVANIYYNNNTNSSSAAASTANNSEERTFRRSSPANGAQQQQQSKALGGHVIPAAAREDTNDNSFVTRGDTNDGDGDYEDDEDERERTFGTVRSGTSAATSPARQKKHSSSSLNVTSLGGDGSGAAPAADPRWSLMAAARGNVAHLVTADNSNNDDDNNKMGEEGEDGIANATRGASGGGGGRGDDANSPLSNVTQNASSLYVDSATFFDTESNDDGDGEEEAAGKGGGMSADHLHSSFLPSTSPLSASSNIAAAAAAAASNTPHNPMRPCLRQDAQSYLRQITRLEQQLKLERDNGRQLVLAHHGALEELTKKHAEQEEKLRQSKNQHDRVKEAYEQVIQVLQAKEQQQHQQQQQNHNPHLGSSSSSTPSHSGGGGGCGNAGCGGGGGGDNASSTNSSADLQIAYERCRSQEEYYRRKCEEANRTVKELRDKLAYNGLGDTPTSCKFSYTITEYETVRQALLKRNQEYERLQESLAANAGKWGTEIKSLKLKAEAATAELNAAKRTIDELKGELISERELAAFQLRRVERDQLGRHVGAMGLKEAEGRQVIRQCEATSRHAILHLFNVLSLTSVE